MKKLFIMMMGTFATVSLFAQKINDPNAEVREAKNFHAINISSAFNVFLDQSEEEGVAVSAAETKFRDQIIVEVKNGVLYIKYNNKGLSLGKSNKELKVYISFKSIDKLNVSGSCNVYITGTLKADDLRISLSGASDIRKAVIDAKKLTVDLSGASDLTITGGSATQLNIDASGASKFQGFDLTVDICNVTASGASDIKITVNKELSAHASGASDIHYKGSGVITDIKTSGSSKISKSDS